jgi:hypothetical protein
MIMAISTHKNIISFNQWISHWLMSSIVSSIKSDHLTRKCLHVENSPKKTCKKYWSVLRHLAHKMVELNSWIAQKSQLSLVLSIFLSLTEEVKVYDIEFNSIIYHVHYCILQAEIWRFSSWWMVLLVCRFQLSSRYSIAQFLSPFFYLYLLFQF